MDCWSLKLTHKIINKKAAAFSCVVAAWIMQMWWSQLVWKMRNKWKAELFLSERSKFVFYLFGQRKEINAHSKRFLCSRGVYSENDFRAFHFNSADWNPSFMQWRLFSPFSPGADDWHVKRTEMCTYSDRASTCNGSAYISFVWKRLLSSRSVSITNCLGDTCSFGTWCLWLNY